MLTLADGQVSTSAAEILSGGSAGAQRITASFVNTNAAAQTLIVTFSRAGGTSRVIRRAVLAQYESLEIRGLPIDAGDSLLAVTTTASAVDYVIGGEGAGSSGPMVSAVYDASGMLKTSNSASTALSTALTVTSASATALAIGPNGTTNPSLVVDASTSSAATGLKLTPGAAAGGVALLVISSGTNENLTINAKGSGTISLNATATGAILIGSNLTMADAKNIVLDTTTGTKIGTATTQKLGFYNATPVVQRSAYTQTFSTADRTHAARTATTLTDNTAGTANTTLQALADGTTYATDVAAIRNNFADLAAAVNALIVDVADTAGVVNSLVDDLQALGLAA